MTKQLGIIPIEGAEFIKTSKTELCTHEVFIDEEIAEPSQYRELISLLYNAGENDQFMFYINTPGGNLSTAMAIIEGMKNTQAHVMGVLMGETHSAGSLLAMYCHELAVLDSSSMMLHNASFGAFGSAGNVKAQANFTVNYVDKIIGDAYEGFLNEEELRDLQKGLELWYSADEIRERMTARVAALDAKMAALEEAVEKHQKKKKKKKTDDTLDL